MTQQTLNAVVEELISRGIEAWAEYPAYIATPNGIAEWRHINLEESDS